MMMHNISTTLAASALCAFLFSACLDENIRTIISADGSCQRIIRVENQRSASPLDDQLFPRPSGGGWTVKWDTIKSNFENQYTYTASKYFRTPEELHAEYVNTRESGRFGIDVSLNRKFRWFFTYFDYKETFNYHNPYGHVPVTKFLTSEEIRLYQRTGKNDSLQEKVDRWKNWDFGEEIYSRFITVARQHDSMAAYIPLIMNTKGELFSRWEKMDSTEKANKKAQEGKKHTSAHSGDSTKPAAKDDTDEQIKKVFVDLWGKEAFRVLGPMVDTVCKAAFDESHTSSPDPDNWKFAAEMPGLLLDANSATVKGNAVEWKFDQDQVRVGDFVMSASSRVANPWAFIVTGTFGLLLVAISFFPPFRRRNIL